MINIVLAGVGGQGTVLASKLISLMLMDKGYYVKCNETIGMAQMGGAVSSHLRASKDKIYSPFVNEGGADMILAFEPAEALRNIRFANKETKIIINEEPIKPVTDTLSKKDYKVEDIIQEIKDTFPNTLSVNLIDFLDREIASRKPLNISIIGMALGLGLADLSLEDGKEAIKKHMPERFQEMNLIALEKGYQIGAN